MGVRKKLANATATCFVIFIHFFLVGLRMPDISFTFLPIYLSICHVAFGQLLIVRPREFSRKMHMKPKSHMFNQITHSTLS